jgi:hypothetical protein
VGKLVFDLEGEYAFGGDDKGKKWFGLADIPSVAERLVVYTNAKRAESEYQAVMAGAPVLNLGEIAARKAVSTLLPESRQERVYADLLKGLTSERWKKVLNLVARAGYDTNTADVAEILGIPHDENLASIQGMIRALVPMTKGHSASSNMMRDVLENLKMGATVIIDLSGMGLDAAYNLTSFMVDELFEANQTAFVAGGNVPEVIVFVEEAQNLLSDRQVREGNPIARLAKEGRKYNLGLVYVSQQPGAIAKEILTQTSTFFALHLLSKMDIKALQDINPHYEGVIADFVQMESLQGHAYIYSTVPEMATQSYVFATKATSFKETIESLKKRPTSGASDIRKYRAEVVTRLAEILKEVLKTQRPVEESPQGEQRYRNAPISGELAKRLPDGLAFVKDHRSPQYTEGYWLLEACQKLGYEARIEWEDSKPYLYLKEKDAPPPVIRPGMVDSSDEFSFDELSF